MSLVNDSIGTRFETVFLENFPGFKPISNGEILPDFNGNGFWVEAKTGNIRFGVRLHEYQVNNFSKLSEPVIYAIGFHNLDHARKRLTQKTEPGRQRFLERNMEIVEVYFVSDAVVCGIWKAESRTNEKGTMLYGICKERFLESIIDGGTFFRGGKKFSARDYYGMNGSYLFRSPSNVGLSFPVGFILNKEKDKQSIEYFKSRGFLN